MLLLIIIGFLDFIKYDVYFSNKIILVMFCEFNNSIHIFSVVSNVFKSLFPFINDYILTCLIDAEIIGVRVLLLNEQSQNFDA